MRLKDPDTIKENWDALFGKIKEIFLTLYTSQVMFLQDAIKKMDSERCYPGWNYCQFFLLKENLSDHYEQLGLLEMALLQFEELEAYFEPFIIQSAEHKAIGLDSFGAVDHDDDSADVLDSQKKNYRSMIRLNSVTVFDFRCYLFARQCHLTYRLRRPAELAKRSLEFIKATAKLLHEQRLNLRPFFEESWVYSTSLRMVVFCEQLITKSPTCMTEQATHQYRVHKAELLFLARRQLDKLGLQCAILPKTMPFVMATLNANLDPSTVEGKISNADLLQAAGDPNKFRDLYEIISKRTIEAMQTASRQQTIAKILDDISSLQMFGIHLLLL